MPQKNSYFQEVPIQKLLACPAIRVEFIIKE